MNNHGMTDGEVAEFRRMKAASRAAQNEADVRSVRMMVAGWIKSAKTRTPTQQKLRRARTLIIKEQWHNV